VPTGGLLNIERVGPAKRKSRYSFGNAAEYYFVGP